MNPLNLILASASPRRRRFLQELNLPHTTMTADVDETPLPQEAASALAARLAMAKAEAVAGKLDDKQRPALIIGADTVVAIDDEVLGKPADEDEAASMLRRLRHGSHQVHSALAAVKLDVDGGCRRLVRVNSTRVTMRPYSDEEIVQYIATGDPLDKAGAYAIQHRTFEPVRSLTGCPAGVMGMPLADLRAVLAVFGILIKQPLPSICHRLTGLSCCQESDTRASGRIDSLESD